MLQPLPPYSESQTQAPVVSSHEPWPLQTLLLLGQAEALGRDESPNVETLARKSVVTTGSARCPTRGR